jgi:hypothetical protein
LKTSRLQLKKSKFEEILKMVKSEKTRCKPEKLSDKPENQSVYGKKHVKSSKVGRFTIKTVW